MNTNSLRHKIQKYSHKLKNTRNLEHAQMYQAKLRHYERMRQAGGAELTEEEKALLAPKEGEKSPMQQAKEQIEAKQAEAKQVEAPVEPDVAEEAQQAEQGEQVPPPPAPAPPVPAPAPVKENRESVQIPEPEVKKTEDGLSLNLSEAFGQFTETLEGYWNKFHEKALNDMEASAALDLTGLESSLGKLYGALDNLKGLNDFNSNAAKAALGKISATANEIRVTAERLKEAQPDAAQRDQLITDVSAKMDELNEFLGATDNRVTGSDEYSGLMAELKKAEEAAKTE